MKQVAVDAQAAAESAAATAGADAAAVAEAAIAGATDEATAAAASAATAATNAASSATAAANAAALVGAPADTAIAAVVNNGASATKAALNATYDPIGAAVKAQPSNAFPARKLAAKLNTRAMSGTLQQARVLALGDSIALFKWHTLYPSLHRAFGGGAFEAGVSVGSSVSGTGWATPGTGIVATTGTVTRQTNAFDIWFSGYADLFATGSTRDYGVAGVNPTWDTLKIYYAKEAGAGTFKVQIDGVDEPGYTSVSAAGTGLGIITITRGTVAQRRVTIVNLTGTMRIIGPGFEASTRPGVVFANVSQGGIALDQQTAQGYANLQAYIADFNPDIITFEMKESSTYYATQLETLLTKVDAGAPTATFVGIGSTPLASGDADQVIQNAQLKAACDAHGKVYWDGYGPFGSYAALNALGWAGDGTHVAEEASSFLAGLMARDLGLYDHAGADRPGSVNAKQVAALNKYVLGALGVIDTTTSTLRFDFTSGNLEFRNAAATVIMRLAQTASNSVLPNAAQFGENNARWTADTNGFSAKTPAGSADANIYGKQICATSQGLRALPVATGSRPSGPTVGDGTMIVDSTLNKPIWYIGGAWRDATGTAV
jgi:hypothetical protein